jgi:hypothetical protein
MAIRYIPATYVATKDEAELIVSEMNENDEVPIDVIVMIDHAYHSEDSDYDGGLSLFDRLHRKLSIFFELGWTAEDLKNQVRDAPDDYMNILKSILDNEKITVYGV